VNSDMDQNVSAAHDDTPAPPDEEVVLAAAVADLRAALDADDIDERTFHIRSALQRLAIVDEQA